MAQISFKSPGVSARTINLTGPTAIQPTGIPAGVIGTSEKGPAFVPVTVATTQDFFVTFGQPNNNAYNGPLAVTEWLRNQQSATYIRVLGVGDGNSRTTSSPNSGKVINAGFVVGDQQPQQASLGGALGNNPYANIGGALGRTYFLGCFMSQSLNSNIFTDAGLPTRGVPVVRGVLLAASGVLLSLSSSIAGSDNDITNSTIGTEAAKKGYFTGSLNLASSRQEFVMLLNGHKGINPTYPLAITASFDVDAPNYFSNMFNTDPYKLEQAGHLLYAEYQIHPSLAVPTGSGFSGHITGSAIPSLQNIAFIFTGSQTRNLGTSTAPNYENFEVRFRTAKSPWIVSQKFGGATRNLFKVFSLHDGASINNQIKISIENLSPKSATDPDPYGSFDLLVRDFNDNDKNKVVLESFRGLNLNPSSPNYIAKVIGDYNTYYNFDTQQQKLVTTGDFVNLSKYIRIQLADEVASGESPESSLPMGFRGPAHLVTSGSSPLQTFSDTTYFGTSLPAAAANVVQIPVPYRNNLNRGTGASTVADKGLYWGVQFEQKTSPLETNKSNTPDPTIKGFTVYYPNYQNEYVNIIVEDNQGVADTTQNGILDADRFNKNGFSLENVQIKYISGSNLADTTQTLSWSYVRTGNITDDTSAFTRALTLSDLTDPTVRQLAKFNLFIQGGFDGVRIFNEDTNELTNQAIVEEMSKADRGTTNGPTVSSYEKSLDLISDITETDIQLLTVPGIRHPIITDRALQVVESRFDSLLLMDVQEYDVNATLVTSSIQDVSVRYTINAFKDRGLNSSFGAAYFPDVIMRDEFNDVIRQVPPSVVVLGAFGKNDSVAYPWFAPAGFTRGALDTTNESALLLSRENLDDLYSDRINPLTSFPGSDGVVIWGQKTVLNSQSALERVNVRRLLIDLRRQVKRIANRIIFEQGKAETLARFSNLVTPILKRIQDQNGVDRYLVKIDTSTTTQADFENKTIRGKIYIQPTRTLEFLSIDFVLTNPGTI